MSDRSDRNLEALCAQAGLRHVLTRFPEEMTAAINALERFAEAIHRRLPPDLPPWPIATCDVSAASPASTQD
jgi:hypothetical protein